MTGFNEHHTIFLPSHLHEVLRSAIAVRLYSSALETNSVAYMRIMNQIIFIGDRHYEKAAKVGTSNTCLKICFVVVFLLTIISLSAAATALAFYFKVSYVFVSDLMINSKLSLYLRVVLV